MSKVAVIAKITTVSGQRDEVVEILRDVVRGADAEPGTLVYAMNIDKADADVIWFYELYTDDDAFAAHGKGSEAMKAAGPRLAGKTAGRPEITVLELVAAKGLPA